MVGSGGASGLVLTIEDAAVRLRGEVSYVQLRTEGSESVRAQSVDAGRLRLMLEGERPRVLTAGRRFHPSLELGFRQDFGDGNTAVGLELGATVRYTDEAEAW